MDFFQNICHFVIWYHQPNLEHQDRSFIVEVDITILGELLVTLQVSIALLSDVGVSQPRRARRRGH